VTNLQWVLVAVVPLGVAVALAGESRGRQALTVAGKSVASASFLALGAVRFAQGDTFGAWVLVALALGAAGDVLLAFERCFRAGLAVFLVSHLAYAAAFHALLPASQWSITWFVPGAVAGVATVNWLWPHLGRERYSVAAYITAGTVMVWGALSIAVDGGAGAQVAIAAVLFMLSDITVARHRFVCSGMVNRVVGLPLYYLAQLLFALTIGRGGPVS